MFVFVKSSFQFLTVSLGSITEGVSVDAVGAVVWIVVFGECSDSSLHRGFCSRQDDDVHALKARVEQLRMDGRREGVTWLRKVFGEMEEHALRSLSAAAGLGLVDGSGKLLPSAKVRASLVKYLAPEAGD